MRVLVTGANGFVGRHLTGRLVGEHEVLAVVRRDVNQLPRGAEAVVCDLSSRDLDQHLPPAVDAIVHLAQAYLPFPEHADEIFDINVGSTQRLADWARRHHVARFVYASSGSVYAPSSHPIAEEVAPRPLAFHPATKLLGELILEQYRNSMDLVFLRLFAPYGPGQTNRLIPRLIASIESGDPVRLSRGGEPRLNPIFIDDLIEILSQAVNGAGRGPVNVGGPRAVSVADIASILGAGIGRSPIFEARDTEPAGDLVADISKMREQFRAPELVDPTAGLATTVRAVSIHASNA